MIDTILTPRVLAIIGVVCLAFFAFSIAWAFFKVNYQRALGRPVPRFWLTNTFDVAAEIGTNLPGAVNRALKLAGQPGFFLPTQPSDAAPVLPRVELQARLAETERSRTALMRAIEESAAPPAQSNGQRGSVSLRVLLALAVSLSVVVPFGAALYGCPASRQLTRPALGLVDGCEPRATRCAPTGRPQVCSGSRRWTDADNVCALGVNVAAVCCLTRSPVTGAELHACVLAERCLAADAGAL